MEPAAPALADEWIPSDSSVPPHAAVITASAIDAVADTRACDAVLVTSSSSAESSSSSAAAFPSCSSVISCVASSSSCCSVPAVLSIPRTLHLILDLDGTLVLDESATTRWEPVPRPHLGHFLSVCFRLCASVSLFTAAGSEWLQRVERMMIERRLLPPGARFLLRWSGERCRWRPDLLALEAGNMYAPRVAVKPLLKMWRCGAGRRAGLNRRNTIIIDDSPHTYAGNYGNALPVRTYTGAGAAGVRTSASAVASNVATEDEDDELLRLTSFLPVLAALPDVRSFEKRGWRLRHGVATASLAVPSSPSSAVSIDAPPSFAPASHRL